MIGAEIVIRWVASEILAVLIAGALLAYCFKKFPVKKPKRSSKKKKAAPARPKARRTQFPADSWRPRNLRDIQ
jgi:phosphate/sulfate permease